ncbi:hypothetical protein FYJ59_12440 [Lachnospiraceae bacterium WCA3-601-WT-6H]|uniref:Uncharacterized protein n=1 Tax=Waltera intestinalis TaxID=2606635 RepID=A0A6L5YM44_9FIRM|nr:hypothetical protein [Waltera intestinalis]
MRNMLSGQFERMINIIGLKEENRKFVWKKYVRTITVQRITLMQLNIFFIHCMNSSMRMMKHMR